MQVDCIKQNFQLGKKKKSRQRNYNKSDDLNISTKFVCLYGTLEKWWLSFLKYASSRKNNFSSNIFVKLIMKILQTSEQLRKCRSFVWTHCPTISHHSKPEMKESRLFEVQSAEIYSYLHYVIGHFRIIIFLSQPNHIGNKL